MPTPAPKPIPDGFHSVTPQLTCKNAEQALEFYKKAFGSEVRDTAKDPQGRVIHSIVKIGDTFVMVTDEYPEYGSLSPASLNVSSPVSLHIYTTDADAMFKQATAAGAKVTMPIMDQFWGDRYGQVVDPYGHRWAIATRKVIYTSEEMRENMQKAFAAAAKKTASH
jgi:PhnB protein